jgi:type IV pilus assembly protein PilC
MRDRIHPAVQKVTEGRALYESLEESQVVDSLAVDMVQVGEATGSLATMLSSVADFLDQEVEIRMGRILSLIEPVMLVFMGIIVGILLVSIYLPMFSLMGQVNG